MSTQKEQLLAMALIEVSCFNKPFPTRDPGYTAQIVKNENVWTDGKLEATLLIKPSVTDDIPDLMSGDTFPIFLWVEVEEGDIVEVYWKLEAKSCPWINSISETTTISECWPVTPGPFLWKPE